MLDCTWTLAKPESGMVKSASVIGEALPNLLVFSRRTVFVLLENYEIALLEVRSVGISRGVFERVCDGTLHHDVQRGGSFQSRPTLSAAVTCQIIDLAAAVTFSARSASLLRIRLRS
jgi:hypothetical protein